MALCVMLQTTGVLFINHMTVFYTIKAQLYKAEDQNPHKTQGCNFLFLNLKMMVLYHTFWVLIAVSCSSGFKHFQQAIPNGNKVPHPCKSNYIWKGVGHETEAGGGTRNPFGLDFFDNEKKWTADLCNKDSDGDGITNGAELGDPDCTWSQGDVPKNSQGLSHPGVCEPLDSALCQGKNDWVNCDVEDFECESILEQGVENVTLRFTDGPVPAEETTYVCQSFALPSDRDYHLIATQPIIDNENIMHHITLYGCPDEAAEVQDKFQKPEECGMATSGCSLIGIWTLGLAGQCFDPMIGFKFGLTSFKFVLMQLHWNNPELRSDYTDSSGLILYYTPNLRPNNAGQLSVGPLDLTIPPGLNSFTLNDTCSSDCTSRLNQTIHFSAVNLHMHYLGISASFEHHRNGKKLRDFAVDASYSYDTPVFHWLDSIEFLPGDEMKLTCEYSSISKTENTYYGEDTSAEMCFALITYYPAEANFHFCLTTERGKWCDISDNRVNEQACEKAVGEIWTALYQACPGYECTEACRQKTTEAKQHECLEDLEAAEQGFEAVGAGEAFQIIKSCDEGFVIPCGEVLYGGIWATLYEACPYYECTDACREKIAAAKNHSCLDDLEDVKAGFELGGAGLAFQYINSCDEGFVKPCGKKVFEEIWAGLYEACPYYECTDTCRQKITEAKKEECLGDLEAVKAGFEADGAGLAFQYINSCDDDFVKPCGDEVFAYLWAGLYKSCPDYKCTEECQKEIKEVKKHECLGDIKAVQAGFELTGQGAAFKYINSCDDDEVNGQTTCHQSGLFLLLASIFMWFLVAQ